MMDYGYTILEADIIFGMFALPLFAIIIGLLILKGYAVYKAARLNDKWWFIALFVLNTAGILPAIYLYVNRNKKV